MTEFVLANIGSYPRIGEEKDQQRYRRGFLNFQNKEISAHAFKDVEQSVILEVVREQIALGLNEVTDGLICWQDPISHFCKSISGVKLQGYDRYFDTNFYYIRPTIEKKPKFKGPTVFNEYTFAKKISSRPIRSVLTGPLTLAHHAIGTIKPYDKLASRVQFFSEVIAQEIRALAKAGATTIQIDEPSLSLNPNGINLLKTPFEEFAKAATPARLILGLSYGPIENLINAVETWPLSGLQLDFTFDGKKLFERILTLGSKLEIGFGVINSRTIRLDAIDPLINMIRTYVDKKTPSTCVLAPSAGLEHLPRNTVMAKLGLLTKIKSELSPSGTSGGANV